MASHPFLIPILIYISPKSASAWQHIPHGWPLPRAPNKSSFFIITIVQKFPPKSFLYEENPSSGFQLLHCSAHHPYHPAAYSSVPEYTFRLSDSKFQEWGLIK